MRAELADGQPRAPVAGRSTTRSAASTRMPATQAILVLNRRGTASVVLCRDCGHVQACPDCERPLVYHQAGTTLRCHHCGRATPLATRCPACALAADPLPRRRDGAGGARGPRAASAPAGRPAGSGRRRPQGRGRARVLDAFAAGRSDVLVGTSLVAKGLDVPGVTLVGVVSSDVALNLPDERAAERTYQLLSQAVGRAGRGDRPGRAILQTYQPDHPAIRAVASGDADDVLRAELDLRRRFGSPPFGRLVKLTVALADRDAAEREGRAMAERLRAVADGRATGHRAGARVHRPPQRSLALQRRSCAAATRSACSTADPGPPWSIDVDPESLL